MWCGYLAEILLHLADSFEQIGMKVLWVFASLVSPLARILAEAATAQRTLATSIHVGAREDRCLVSYRVAKVSAIQIGVGEVASAQVSHAQPGTGEVGASEIRSTQVGAKKHGEPQLGVTEATLLEYGA